MCEADERAWALLVRLAGTHEGLGKELDSMGGVLRCSECKAEKPMVGAARYLALGWPQCCGGATMTWVTARQLASENC
jgi:hypothetical protein